MQKLNMSCQHFFEWALHITVEMVNFALNELSLSVVIFLFQDAYVPTQCKYLLLHSDEKLLNVCIMRSNSICLSFNCLKDIPLVWKKHILQQFIRL